MHEHEHEHELEIAIRIYIIILFSYIIKLQFLIFLTNNFILFYLLVLD